MKRVLDLLSHLGPWLLLLLPGGSILLLLVLVYRHYRQPSPVGSGWDGALQALAGPTARIAKRLRDVRDSVWTYAGRRHRDISDVTSHGAAGGMGSGCAHCGAHP